MNNEPRPALEFDFPLPRPLAGIALGNGRQGLLVWGDERLCVTVARAGFWDHRGGGQVAPGLDFARLRAWLEAGDEPAIQAAFAGPPRPGGSPAHPYQIGGGRLELEFPGGLRPERARVDLSSGRVTVLLSGGAPDDPCEEVVIHQAVNDEVAWIALPEALAARVTIRQSPAWRFAGQALAAWGVAPPEVEERPGATGGTMLQRLPEDAGLAIAWRRDGGRIALATALGTDAADDPRPRALARLATDPEAAVHAAQAWWARFWSDVPDLDLPDPVLMQRYRLGLWCLAGCTMAEGDEAVAAGLQGPFMEDSKLPDWSNDYHCNINVQTMYWPLLACNRTEQFAPLWRMLRAWMPLLRERGQSFFGTEGALMLPHATDDRCQVVGDYWTGTIDHACCAWMAQLAWLSWRYGGDDAVLRDVAWPLLAGAFEGYWAMAERVRGADGQERLSLPVTVSPEYYGSAMQACGRDASFQLAAFRCVAAILPAAAEALGRPADPRWAEALALVPEFSALPVDSRERTTSGVPIHFAEKTPAPERRIAMREGLDLEESHRHHSHLAAVYPFATVDPADPAHAGAVRAAMSWWTLQGAGYWAGWSLPWASILCARMDRAQAAVAWLHWMELVFGNEGGLTTHSGARGATVMCFGSAELAREAQEAGRPDCEVMQMDATLGAVTAVTELLVQCRPGNVIAVLPTLPVGWREARFDGVSTEGGFRVGATVRRGRRAEVRVIATRGGRLRLLHGLGERYLLDGQPAEGLLLETDTRPGQQLTLKRVERLPK